MAIKRFVFVSDFHAPNHLPQAVALVIAYIKRFKPGLLVFGGDIVDFMVASKFVRMNAQIGPQTVKEEANTGVKEVIEPICKAAGPACEKHYVEGNHEIRVLRMIAANAPALAGLADLSEILGCKRLGITYHASKGGNGHFTVGNMTFMHGERYGVNPAKLQYEDWGGPVIFGHSHKESTWRKKTGSGRDEVALGAGCLSMDPDYRDMDNYTRGFVSGWINEETGEYFAEHIRLSGENHTYLYSGVGEFSAKFIRERDGRERWVAESIGDPQDADSSKKRRKGVGA